MPTYPLSSAAQNYGLGSLGGGTEAPARIRALVLIGADPSVASPSDAQYAAAPWLYAMISASGATGQVAGSMVWDLTTPGDVYVAKTDGTTVKVFSNGTVTAPFANAAISVNTISSLAGTTGTFYVSMTDNLASAFSIREGANKYLDIKTTNSTEEIDLGNATTNPLVKMLGTGGTDVSAGTLTVGAMTVSGTETLSDGSLLLVAGSTTGTGRLVQIFGPDSTHGLARYSYTATVSPAAIETALFTVPANSRIVSTSMNIESALTGGGTTVTASIGITGDVDAYGTMGAPTNLLTKNSKGIWMGSVASGAGASLGVFSKSTVALKLIAAATGGTAAGDTALTAGSVKVIVIYDVLLGIADAA